MRKHVMTICGAAATVLATVGGVSAQPAPAPTPATPTWSWGGDVRVRYDGRFRNHAVAQNRFRVRARIGANGKLAEGKVAWGLALATGTNNPISRNVTFGGGDLNAGSADNGLGAANFGIDKAYLAFMPNDRLNITVGKSANPFWTSDAVFDPDLTPEGASVSYLFYPGHKGDLFSNVKSTTAYFGIRELGGVTNDPWMLGEQITARAGDKVDVGLGLFFFSGLNSAPVANAGSAAAMGQAANQLVGGKFAHDDMAVVDGKVRVPFSIGKFPIVAGAEVFANVRESKNMMGFEGRFDFPKFLGSGRADVVFRNVDQNATFSPWSDDDLGEGTGYKTGLRLHYAVPVYKNVTFEALGFHYDRFQPLSNPAGRSTNRLFLQVMAGF